ncbi:DUF1553 domain-containing protein [Candidatus Laterigemmans baculatus]|uniref:DUF1553 domain-containing protein n=1 Tax=Candidatus Laterigemmans baculatus TaxID=2770505 RepID=UPI0013DD5E83|nr:DUF1553 domain-containing protein [Candidatus Laterigemmans baculatus]
MFRFARLCLAASLLGGVGLPATATAEPPSATAKPPADGAAHVDFTSQIQPLLSDRCALCHGPDAATREAELRVDTPDLLSRQSHSGGLEAIVVAGDAAASELVRRITSDDPSERMPPPESNLALSPEEIARITRWIDEGAEWQQHWSLRPIHSPEVPSPAADRAPPPSAIDAFIEAQLAAQLAAERLRPLGSADPHSLIRRLSMDLTGLPPSPEEVERFAADSDPQAYERLVDRLLASPAFGERMATPWLDLARYADTYGYQADVYRDVWPWRDWVIHAFASGLSYDDFLTQQLAGDLLPAEQLSGSTPRDAALATAFNRLHRQTNEGGSVEEEFRAEYAADRVNTFGTAVLGLTLECARCHDHKYDPISQRDYYRLFAFFNQIDESGLYSHFTDAVPTPVLDLPTAAQQQALDAARTAAKQAEREYRELRDKRLSLSPERAAADPASLAGLWSDEVGRFEFEPAAAAKPAAEANGAAAISLANAIAGGAAGKWIGQPVPFPGLAADAASADEPQRPRHAIEFDGENGFETEVGGDWDWWQPFTIALWLRPAVEHQRAVVWHRSRAWTDAGSRGYELLNEEGRLSAALVHFWPGDAVRVRTVEPLPAAEWSHVAVRSDGSGRAAGLRIFVDGQPVELEVIRDSLKRTIRGGGATTLALGSRFRDRGFTGGAVAELRIFERDLSAVEIALLSAGPQIIADRGAMAAPGAIAGPAEDFEPEALRLALLEASDAELRQARATLRQRRQEWAAARDAIPAIMAMEELAEPRATYVLRRGQYDAPGEEVSAGVPETFGPMPSSLPRNRLGLARWVTDPEHPLVARVVVNRTWQMLFDRPLVATPDDFGMQGEPPTHPQLLDYLAHTLIAEEWDLKRLVRRIVTSAAYRRASSGDPHLHAVDPENRLLARGPESRWPVEMIRDAALAVGGLLDRRIGGPPVRPYQPPGLWEEKQAGAKYVRDLGSGSHRRSLYTIWKRTSPPPSMMIFDAPGREVCAASRATTETPLQALVLLNDEQYVEAARGVGFLVLRGSTGDAEDYAERLWLRMLGRLPLEEERRTIVAFVKQQAERFDADPAARDAYLAVGDFSPQLDSPLDSPLNSQSDSQLDRSEWAAWSVAAQMLMNLQEWVSRR